MPRVAIRWWRCLRCDKKGSLAFYWNVSGGLGQIYDLAFLAIAAMRSYRVILHHHSFAYLGERKVLTSALMRCAPRGTLHIVLSDGMKKRLGSLYGVKRIRVISNAAWVDECRVDLKPRSHLRMLGFIGNISAEKGIFDFIEFVNALTAKGIAIRGVVAGPFQDSKMEVEVRHRIERTRVVEYLGARYGAEKEKFLADIDTLVFPTRYINEAEPVTILEALGAYVPVIAYARGCIPDLLRGDCGRAVPVGSNFVTNALPIVASWVKNQGEFHRASVAARARFESCRETAANEWRQVEDEMREGCSDIC